MTYKYCSATYKLTHEKLIETILMRHVYFDEQVMKMMSTTSSYPMTTMTMPNPETENGGNCNDYQFNPPRINKLKTRRLRIRVLLSLFGVVALILVIVPSVIMVILQENKGSIERDR